MKEIRRLQEVILQRVQPSARNMSERRANLPFFLRRVLRLGFFAFSRRFSVGRFHFFGNHRGTLNISWQDQIISSIPYIA